MMLLVDGKDGEDGVASDVRVTMFQTRTDRRHQRLQQFRFLKLAQKAQS